jgi:hypothetical protein
MRGRARGSKEGREEWIVRACMNERSLAEWKRLRATGSSPLQRRK